METFEHFEEQERSWAYLDDLGEKLAKEAAEVLAQDPDAKIAGLILEGRTPEAEGLWVLVEQATGEKLAGPRCAGLIPRDLIAEILRRTQAPGRLSGSSRMASPGGFRSSSRWSTGFEWASSRSRGRGIDARPRADVIGHPAPRQRRKQRPGLSLQCVP